MCGFIQELNGLSNMEIKRVIVGPLEENCYIVTKNNQTIIIDPGDEAEKIINVCNDLNVVGVLITHHHFDHTGALKEIEEHFNIKEGNCPNIGFETIKNPGHSKDSVSYYVKEEKVLFCGDFIFKDSIGRTDLESGSDIAMIESLKMISKYPDDLVLYPGHGDKTTLGYEKNNFKYYYKFDR